MSEPLLNFFNTLQPIFWILLTLLVYVFCIGVFKFFSWNILFHPILLGAILIGAIGWLSGINMQDYPILVSPINWLLGPVTVALAIPMYQQIKLLAVEGSKAIAVILVGGCMAPLLALGCLAIFDFSYPLKMSVLTKSITTPLAIDTAYLIGGVPELAAAVVVITGIIGVMLSSVIFKLTGCVDSQAKGLALGTVSHAIGTARAHQIDPQAGAFSSMALCVNGLVTAIVLPVVFAFLN